MHPLTLKTPFRAIPFLMITILLATAGPLAAAPNFLVFIADDQGFGDLSCYGHPTLRTPNVDRLAREGIRFDAAFLTTSSRSPTRASLVTGRYPHNTGAEDLHEPLPADQQSIARYLGGAGYHTMAVGKWHMGQPEKRHWKQIVECSGGFEFLTGQIVKLTLTGVCPPGMTPALI